MGNELKPCPLCSGKAYANMLKREKWEGRSGAYISCQRKSCRLTTRVFNTRADAIAAWNTRAYEAELTRYREDAERLAEALADALPYFLSAPDPTRSSDDVPSAKWSAKKVDAQNALAAHAQLAQSKEAAGEIVVNGEQCPCCGSLSAVHPKGCELAAASVTIEQMNEALIVGDETMNILTPDGAGFHRGHWERIAKNRIAARATQSASDAGKGEK